ncbi:MAG TPA: hypothetical protein PK619_01445 [bacterium]|nr:hypothetical protein [bacterium]HPN80972.1 hypothetical protein [bacterium]HPW39366.1 hypothetical protein [bacterium]
MPGERDYYWYLKPLDSYTNEVIANLAEAIFEDGVLCQDGGRRGMWLCPREIIASLKRSRTKLRLKFEVFVREGGSHCPARPFIFDQ